MPSIEDRLLHCLEANLEPKEEVARCYGPHIDLMRQFSFGNSISEHIATALNIYRKNDKKEGSCVEPKDVEGYKLLHTPENIKPHEQRHGIKTFMFGIEVSGNCWNALVEKLDLPKWSGGIYIPSGNFSGFYNAPLYFNMFGMVLAKGQGPVAHESLHADRRFYSANFEHISGYTENPSYSENEFRAKVQMSFIDEILCYMNDRRGKGSIKRLLKGKYLEHDIKHIVNRYPGLNDDEKKRKRKELRKMLEPVRSSTRRAVWDSHYLLSRMDFSMLTPFFYALGPTKEEFNSKKFQLPFEDISQWADALRYDRIRHATIREILLKKGYCNNS